jgi:glyoxylase-like metal-dependent hydrolase (beta-lactamase superfamily II)
MEYEKYTIPDPLFDTSNVYRVGDTLVDTGSIPSSRGDPVPIEDVINDTTMDRIERVVVTHPHVDHIGGSETSRLLSSLPHVVYDGGQSVLKDFESYLDGSLADWRLIQRELPADNSLIDFEWPQEMLYFGKYIPVEQTVTHGETVWIDDDPFEVVHTPGHDRYHMALRHIESNTVLTGDLVLSHGYYIRGPFYPDVTTYEASLQRLRSLDPDRLLPGHGDVIDNPGQVIDRCLSMSDELRQFVRSTVSDTSITLRAIVDRMLDDSGDEYKRWLFTTTVFAYVEEMVNTGDAYIDCSDRITVWPR